MCLVVTVLRVPSEALSLSCAAVCRYILSMTISDQTGRAWVTAFNDVAEPLLNGRTADELYEMKLAGEVSWEMNVVVALSWHVLIGISDHVFVFDWPRRRGLACR